jgi:PAS domain S-box-containing protein
MNSKHTGIFFRWTKPFLPVLMVVVAVSMFVSHPLQGEIPASPITVPDTIVVGSEPSYPPYCLLDKKGNPEGFSIELIRAVARAAGIEVKFKIGAWNVIHTELEKGEIDALPIVGFNSEREEKFEFSMPYLTLHNAFFIRKGTHGINSIDDLRDKEILVMNEDNAEYFLRREKLTDKIYTTTSFEEAFVKLESGQHDAVFVQRLTGIKILENMKIRSIEPLNIQSPLLRIDYCFAVQKGNRQLVSRLNEGLSIVIANNTYKEIYQNWFGSEVKIKTDTWYYIKIAVLIFVPLAIAMSLVSISLLRKEVKRQTHELNREIDEHKKTLETLNQQQSVIETREEQIRLLLNSTAEGIYGINLDGNCTFINRSALQILKYSDEEEVLGKNMHELIHHTRADGSVCTIEDCKIFQAFREGFGTHADDEILWRSDGTSFFAEYFSHPIRQNNAVIGSVVTFWNITDRKKSGDKLKHLTDKLEEQVRERTAELEEKVNKLNKSQKAMLFMVEDLNRITQELKEERRKLELSNKELDAFSYSVSHDLRSPLRAIDGFSRFLLEDYFDRLDDEGKRYIHVIRQNTQKMDTLISDILSLSRVSRTDIRQSSVDMQATARSMFLEIATDEEKQKFEFDLKEIPPVMCDFSLIKQVWQNLIGNALKYSSKSELQKIEIGAREDEAATTFYVKDWGTGFDPAYTDKLFGVFQRLHRADEFEGTGVGLAIVQRIVHRHGGQVWAESEPGKGATFFFSIPKYH